MKLKITRFKQVDKEALKAYLDIDLEDLGWTITDCRLMDFNGKRVVGMPQRSYLDKEGNKKYIPIVRMPRAQSDAFSADALLALSEYVSAEQQWQTNL